MPLQGAKDSLHICRSIMNRSDLVIPLAINLPNPGGYVRVWRYIKERARSAPNARGELWNAFGTALEHLRDFDKALTARINARGQVHTGDSERFWQYMRDRRKLEDFRIHRIVHSGSGFERKEMRNRFPDVQERMTSREY